MVVMKNMFQKFTFLVALLVAGNSSVVLAEGECAISNTQAQLIAVQLIQDTKDSSDLTSIQDRIDSLVTLENDLTDPACAQVAEEINGAARISTALIAQKSINNNLNF